MYLFATDTDGHLTVTLMAVYLSVSYLVILPMVSILWPHPKSHRSFYHVLKQTSEVKGSLNYDELNSVKINEEPDHDSLLGLFKVTLFIFFGIFILIALELRKVIFKQGI